MKNTLFWRLSASITIATITLFSLINYLTDETEWHMSFIKIEHQQQLNEYAKHAEQLYLQGQHEQLSDWLGTLQKNENTWVAIVKSSLTPTLGTYMQQEYLDRFVLGRGIDWKVHLYFNQNPVMEVPFVDKNTHFLIQLPERMRPGAYWQHMDLLLQVILPLLPLLLLTWLIYQYVMSPLQRLGAATRKFSEGDHLVRVRPSLGSRNDELTDLADAFDQMAENTNDLIIKQRQLIADLSHELRTPITRMEMAIGSAKQGISETELLPRLEKETAEIRMLIEDTLTLAWLENEKPILTGEAFDLIELIDIILEDAQYEFPHAQFITSFPPQLALVDCSQRALVQALENLIRNALKYSPINKAITITVDRRDKSVLIIISDQGNGVPDEYLESIFQPFFRVDKSRDKSPDGFGLGLALARRQIEAISGSLSARNLNETSLHTKATGLQMTITLPYP
ncbi:histidine kinase sensor domain-containing protein [Psychromonas sp. SP041]|uniref:histidine kinase sensor domain-containing protein n=1 Tax=Psychromonas sp. SP041 TaxID=1365007 RepID=UPI000414EC01|nr:histidine kinase sensor domain-containing protein [Psychromonas sp. SP041]